MLQLWGSDVALARRIARSHGGSSVEHGSSSAPRRRSPTRRARSGRARCAWSRRGQDPRGRRRARRPAAALYVGRLSEEKGVRELAEAAVGLPLDVVGDGPLRSLFPQAVGFVPPRELGAYERAAIVVVPSRREGYGMVAREAMAHGRPVVATAVGGLVDAVEDGVTGILVPPGDPAALRTAVLELLDDAPRRAALGQAARLRTTESFGGAWLGESLRRIYVDATT